jgi:hypothetical protein
LYLPNQPVPITTPLDAVSMIAPVAITSSFFIVAYTYFSFLEIKALLSTTAPWKTTNAGS